MNDVIPITAARSTLREQAHRDETARETDGAPSAEELVRLIRDESPTPELHLEMVRSIMGATRP